MDHLRSKTRLLAQILEKPCVCHIFCPVLIMVPTFALIISQNSLNMGNLDKKLGHQVKYFVYRLLRSYFQSSTLGS